MFSQKILTFFTIVRIHIEKFYTQEKIVTLQFSIGLIWYKVEPFTRDTPRHWKVRFMIYDLPLDIWFHQPGHVASKTILKLTTVMCPKAMTLILYPHQYCFLSKFHCDIMESVISGTSVIHLYALCVKKALNL